LSLFAVFFIYRNVSTVIRKTEAMSIHPAPEINLGGTGKIFKIKRII